MPEELERIETIKAIIDEKTINNRYPQIIIESEIVDYAEYVTEKVIGRTIDKEGYTERCMGILGQELFNGFLLQYKIPNVYANPIYKEMTMRQIGEKHFDFIIPHMPEGTKIIGVKVTREGKRYKRFLANTERWKMENHNITIAIKIDNLQQRKAHIAGWLYSKEVENLPIRDFGQGNAYWTFLNPSEAKTHEISPLHSINQLMQMLLEGSLKF